MIDGVRTSCAAMLGRRKDKQAQESLKRRKQARDKAEDLRFELELKKEMGYV